MQWLVTFNLALPLPRLRAMVEALGGRVTAEEPVPVGKTEMVIPVDGSKQLADSLLGRTGIVNVSPSSLMGYY